MRALCLLRDGQAYRREFFCEGLAKVGYKLKSSLPDPQPEDVLCIWNRYAQYDGEARRFERAGARVVVAENGYMRSNKTLGAFALAQNHHSGAGTWRVGGKERWASLGIPLAPWREDGDEVIILGQRGIGEPGIAAPRGWAEQTRANLRTGRIREHPGRGGKSASIPLVDDLKNARVVVTWHSAAALEALALGIPVVTAFPGWIGAKASTLFSEYGKTPLKRCDSARLAMFERLAWAQWGLGEIKSGKAFAWLLDL